MATNVTFIGVYRLLDQVCIASYSSRGSASNDEVAVKRVISASEKLDAGRRYSNEGSVCCVHYVSDEANRVYAVVTEKSYPARVAFSMIDEIQSRFLTKVGDKSLTAKEGTLSKQMQQIFADMCSKYDDVKNIDRLSALQGKVDIVKSKMEENITQILKNEEKLETITANAESLNVQAKQFEKRSVQVKKQMQWKSIKTWILLGLVVVTALVIIIVPLVVMN